MKKPPLYAGAFFFARWGGLLQFIVTAVKARAAGTASSLSLL
jgi:hypothetical protein